MKYINTFQEGTQVKDVYLCKKANSATTKAGKAYMNVTLQDKTGTIDAKIWDPDSPGIGEFEELDYVWVIGDVSIFNERHQLNIRQLRRAGEDEYDPSEYLPTSDRPISEMYAQLTDFIQSIQSPYMRALLEHFFVDDETFRRSFCQQAFKNGRRGSSIYKKPFL